MTDGNEGPQQTSTGMSNHYYQTPESYYQLTADQYAYSITIFELSNFEQFSISNVRLFHIVTKRNFDAEKRFYFSNVKT